MVVGLAFAAICRAQHIVSLAVCLFASIHASGFTRIHTYAYTSLRAYVFTGLHASTHTCLRAYGFTCLRVYVLARIRAYVLTSLRAYVLTSLRVYALASLAAHTKACYFSEKKNHASRDAACVVFWIGNHSAFAEALKYGGLDPLFLPAAGSFISLLCDAAKGFWRKDEGFFFTGV